MKTLRRCSALFLVVVSLGSSDQDCSKEVNFQEEVERLERQLENYRHVVEQQESLIEVSGHRPQHQAPENKPTNAAAYSPKPHAEFWNIKIGLLQYPSPPPPKKKNLTFFPRDFTTVMLVSWNWILFLRKRLRCSVFGLPQSLEHRTQVEAITLKEIDCDQSLSLAKNKRAGEIRA